MRLLHTSDWHVGKTVRGRSRADEHRAVLAEIVRVADAEDVDVVLVGGDLFDTAAPAPESESIVYRALLDLADTGAEVVVVAGNHDNPRRLAAVEPLLGLTRVHVGAYLTRPDDGGVLHLDAGGQAARIGLLPFLSQQRMVRADDLLDPEKDAGHHGREYAARCRRVVAALAEQFRDDTVNVLLAHLTVTGGRTGGGEREAHTIFDYHVPAQVFPASAHYVALGHLHRPQQLPAACPVWYPGSPLHLDFGEAPGHKAVLVVDAEPGTPARVREVELTAGRPLRTVTGTLDELAAAPRDDEAYLRVVVREPRRPGLADEVRELLPDAVDVRVEPPDDADGDPRDAWDRHQLERSPDELFGEYLAEQGVDDAELRPLFRELEEELHASDEA